MFDILFSFDFTWIAILMILLSSVIAYTCVFLRNYFLYISTAEWLAEHIYCPLFRVLLLLLMAFLLFPLMIESTSYRQLSQLFFQTHFLINLVNILFFSSLLFTFLPILKHQAYAMPLSGCIATALLYFHQIALPAQINFNWLPTFGAFGMIVLLMIVSYILSRWLNEVISQWIDLRFMVTESKILVTDINHLIFQMPVILVYGQSLTL